MFLGIDEKYETLSMYLRRVMASWGRIVVGVDQLLGAARTQKLVELLSFSRFQLFLK